MTNLLFTTVNDCSGVAERNAAVAGRIDDRKVEDREESQRPRSPHEQICGQEPKDVSSKTLGRDRTGMALPFNPSQLQRIAGGPTCIDSLDRPMPLD